MEVIRQTKPLRRSNKTTRPLRRTSSKNKINSVPDIKTGGSSKDKNLRQSNLSSSKSRNSKMVKKSQRKIFRN